MLAAVMERVGTGLVASRLAGEARGSPRKIHFTDAFTDGAEKINEF